MPYVITTRTPAVTVSDEPCDRITRRAVATLEELNAAVRAICDPTGGRDVWTDPTIYNRCLDDGGTVGPLPDGTVIVVERAREATR